MSRPASAPTDRRRERRPGRRPGPVARALSLALAVLAVASCTGVLSLDDFEPAAGSLCGLLDSCYGALQGCQVHVEGRLDRAALPSADGWLTTLGDEGCLDNCAAARSCLDLSPICLPNRGDACTVKEECCSFTKGAVDCVRERCCLTDGQRCASGADCCGSTCSEGRCGGLICRDPGAPCDLDQQCCSGSCRGNACTEDICRPDGFECADAGQCCSEFCNAGGRCGQPQCQPEGGACDAEGDCCDDLVCHPIGLRSFCSPGQCTPRGVDCSADGQCCTGFCDPVYRVCADGCREAGAACEVSGQCCTGTCPDGTCAGGCSLAYCDTNADCCSGKCVAHTCAPTCVATDCSHGMCETGGPLQASCPSAGALEAACIDDVCKMDPFCCCNGWDGFCVSLLSLFPGCSQKCP